jgi:hypothetical protein
MLGLSGMRVKKPEQVGPPWDAALAADRPFVIVAVVVFLRFPARHIRGKDHPGFVSQPAKHGAIKGNAKPFDGFSPLSRSGCRGCVLPSDPAADSPTRAELFSK